MEQGLSPGAARYPLVVRLFPKIFPEDFNPHCDLDHKDSNQKLPQNTLVTDDAPLCHVPLCIVWLQKI